MRFKVGDVVVLVPAVSPHPLMGAEVTVLERRHYNGLTGEGTPYVGPIYRLDVANRGGTFWWIESVLRPKRPPAEQLGSWDEIERTVDWSPRVHA